MKKGVFALLFIPIIFTIVVIMVIFVSLKSNVTKIVDLEFKADASQATLGTFMLYNVYDSYSNRNQAMMELIGEFLLKQYYPHHNIVQNPQDEIPTQKLVYNYYCTEEDDICKLEGLHEIVPTRLNQLIFTTCYEISFNGDEFFVFGGHSKTIEAKNFTGKADCDIQFPSEIKIPLPYNPDKLTSDVRLKIE